jgi:hypothetical protein
LIDRHRIEFRAVLYVLGGIQFLNGIWITISPTSFYDDFPLGRGWVEALPAYNEHLMRDVGGLFLATGLVLLVAGVWLERRVVLLALTSYLLFAVPHTIYHLLNLEPYGTGDAIGNAVALAATVLLPVYLLALLARDGTVTASSPPPDP